MQAIKQPQLLLQLVQGTTFFTPRYTAHQASYPLNPDNSASIKSNSKA